MRAGCHRLRLVLAVAVAVGLVIPGAAEARIVVEAKMTVIPGDPRVGDPVKIRVDGFRDVRSVTPKLPFSEDIRQTSDPAPFLAAESRSPDVYTLRGGKHIYLPLRRTGPASFETATFRWPDEGRWWTTPRFFLDEKVWAFREGIFVRDGGPPPARAQRVIELDLVDESAPGRPPDWAKPIAYALIGGFALLALVLAVVVARLVRSASAGPGRGFTPGAA